MVKKHKVWRVSKRDAKRIACAMFRAYGDQVGHADDASWWGHEVTDAVRELSEELDRRAGFKSLYEYAAEAQAKEDTLSRLSELQGEDKKQ